MTNKNSSLITLPYKIERAAPAFIGEGLQSPDTLVRHFIGEYTKRGDKVFDPFAGLGTSLFVAESMGRIPYGIEADGDCRDWVAGQLEHWTHLVHQDAGKMDKIGFPKMDFCITCPPYMKRSDTWNPLYGGDPKYKGYDAYLRRMRTIFSKLPAIMKRNATVIVQADNIMGKTYTPLVADFIQTIGKHLTLENEIIVNWKTPAPQAINPTHTHCLVFKNNKVTG